MQQDPSWRRIHPQVSSAAVLGLMLKPYAAVQLFVPVVATVSLHVFQLKLFVDSHLLTGMSLLLQHWFFRDCQKYNQAAARAGGGINAMYHRCNQIDAV